MSKSIRTFVALVAVLASLAFTAIGVARAASGVVLHVFPQLGSSLVSLADASQTPEPTQTVEASQTPEPTVTVEAAEAAEPNDVDDDEEVHAVGTAQAGQTEMDDDNSQGNNNSQGEDSCSAGTLSQAGGSDEHHSCSGGSGSSGSGC